MAKNGYKIIDCDLHIMEPWDLWLRYIDPKFKADAPIGSREFLVDSHLIHDGKLISKLPKLQTTEQGHVRQMADSFGRTKLFEEYDERGWGPDVQIEAMDREGIDLAVLFPTRGLYAHAKIYKDNDLAAAISRAYNDWLAEFCSFRPDRLFGAALVPAQNVEAAVHEVRRAKQELGFKAVFIRPNPVLDRNWHEAVYDPLWAECEKQGLVVGFHEANPCALPVAVADRFVLRDEYTWNNEHVASHPIEMMYAVLCMINGGVLERHPSLRTAFLEANCSWVPYWLWRMDEHWEKMVPKYRTKLSPSEHFTQQCAVSIEADEETGRYAIDWLKGERIMFSTDFPHRDTHFPKTVDTLLAQGFADADAKRKILWNTPAAFYGLG